MFPQSSNNIKSGEGFISKKQNLQESINQNQFNEKIIRINKSDDGISALPPPLPSFIEMLPTVLYTIFIQIQTLYFIVVGVLIFFRYCDRQVGPLVTHFGFLLGYILIETVARYLTFRQYQSCPYRKTVYEFLGSQKWKQIFYQDIKVGQVIKIKRDQFIPVNILPIATNSKKNYIFIDTFPIQKQHRLTKISIIPQLNKFFEEKHHENYEIKYQFFTDMGQIFQSQLYYNSQQQTISVANKNAIPRGTKLHTEQFIIGIVLFNLKKKATQQMKKILKTQNSIDNILMKHLITVIICMLISSSILVLIAAAVIYNSNHNNFYSELGCYFINILALFCQSVHVTMYLYHSLRRLIDALSVGRKKKVYVKNFIKSLDQFGIVDTIISDDYLFLRRRLLKLCPILYNDQCQIKTKPHIIQNVIKMSQEIRIQYPDQWLALYKQSEQEIDLSIKQGLTQKSDKEIKISIKIDERHFLLKFTQKPRIRSLQSMRDENLRSEFAKAINTFRDNQGLIFMVYICQIENYKEKEIFLIDDSNFEIHTLLTFSYTFCANPVRFLKQVKRQHNIIIMTQKTCQQMQAIMTQADLKSSSNQSIIFQDQTLKQFNQELYYRVKKLPQSQKIDKSKILCFDGNLVSHLCQKKIRQYLKKLSKISEFFIFYNCTEHQKQMCAAYIFKIFPRHLYFSNFQCDDHISRISNVSACLIIAPSSPYTTVQVASYEALYTLLTKNAVHSIRVTLHILYTHIFKNQLFISSSITAMFLVYRGTSFYTGTEYSQYIFFFYNLFFSLISQLFYVIKRPKSYRIKKAPKYSTFQLILQHAKGIIMGIILTLIIYAFISEEFIPNIFMSILIVCIITSNFYHLVIDRALNKIPQLLIILFQCLLIIGLIFLLVQVYPFLNDRIILIEVNLYKSNVYFYIVSFLICPIVSISTLYIFALVGSIDSYNYELVIDPEIQITMNDAAEIAGINKSFGKQLKFRYL